MVFLDKGYKFSSAEVKKVKRIQFSVLGPDELVSLDLGQKK